MTDAELRAAENALPSWRRMRRLTRQLIIEVRRLQKELAAKESELNLLQTRMELTQHRHDVFYIRARTPCTAEP